jgi:hypothetical protein
MATTDKISITLGREELRSAKQLASELGLSLSTFVNEAVRERLEARARQRAGFEVLATFGPEDRATPAEQSELLARWAREPDKVAPKAKRRRPQARRAQGR